MFTFPLHHISRTVWHGMNVNLIEWVLIWVNEEMLFLKCLLKCYNAQTSKESKVKEKGKFQLDRQIIM
jgi:hypothetical protein